MKTLALVIGLSIYFAFPAYADQSRGHETGHGGDAIVCEHIDGSRSIQVLDYFEAGQTMGLTPDLGSSGSYLDRAKVALGRLRSLDSTAYGQYVQWVDEFESEMQLADRSQIRNIDDSYELIKPRENCVDNYKRQFAVQLSHPSEYEKRYIIDKALWDEADPTQKAGLVLHEIFYREAFNLDPYLMDSRKTRYFNAVLASATSNKLSFDSYQRLLRESGRIQSGAVNHTTVINGTVFHISSLVFYPSGTLMAGSLFESQSGVLASQPGLHFKGDVEFYEDGTLKSGYPVDPIRVNGYDSIFSKIIFDENGNLATASVDYILKQAKINIKPADISGDPALIDIREVKFYPSGKIKNVWLASDYDCGKYPIFMNGQTVPIAVAECAGMTADFYESGYLKDIDSHFVSSIPYFSKPGISAVLDTIFWKGTIELDPAGRLYRMNPSEYETISLSIGETTQRFSGTLEFYQNGVPHRAYLSEKTKFRCEDGKTSKTIKEPGFVEFTPTGLLKCKG